MPLHLSVCCMMYYDGMLAETTVHNLQTSLAVIHDINGDRDYAVQVQLFVSWRQSEKNLSHL